LSEAVNEGVERAHREGLLTSASLMVAAPAAADAVRRAKTMPGLRVGLHLVVIDGPSVLGTDRVADLVDGNSRFPSDQLRLGLRYFFSARVRRQLAAEIRAQFAAYAATGLTLDHADAHKHMHLHPTVGGLLVRIGRSFGLRAVRVPAEPASVMSACGVSPTLGGRALPLWSAILRGQISRAGMLANDHLFGLAWTGHISEDRLLRLVAHLPDGLSEIYFHPASRRDATLVALMPTYEHPGELACLLSPAVRDALARAMVTRTSFGEIAAAQR
jgi:chitin disaccharide deacetylase